MGSELAKLKEMMSLAGVSRLYVKRLAPNDNSKNQVYLGPNFEVLNILPSSNLTVEETSKGSILKSSLHFFWLGDDGGINEAPGTQLILYPQYPEVRMSGFLRGCKAAPSNIMASREEGRVLFLGVCNDDRIIAFSATSGSEIVNELDSLGELPILGLFNELLLDERTGDTRTQLLSELRRIHELGWVESIKLTEEKGIEPCNSSHCGGYTLEALLGVSANSKPGPDYLDWELKTHGVKSFNKPNSGSPITLFTPEPTNGLYKDKGVQEFIRKYGYKDKLGREDRINFGGVYRAGKRVESTGITLILDGYSSEEKKITDISKGITLVSDSGECAAVWSYKQLIEHWNTKHDKAAYVMSLCEKQPSRLYSYGSIVHLGVGTDFLNLLSAFDEGIAYYDPGIKLEKASTEKPRIKRRSQFRMKWCDLGSLYSSMESVDVMRGKN